MEAETELKVNGNVFDADLERTQAYCQSNTLCTCADCRRCRENVRQRYPKLTALLERFGTEAEALRELRVDPTTQGWALPAN